MLPSPRLPSSRGSEAPREHQKKKDTIATTSLSTAARSFDPLLLLLQRPLPARGPHRLLPPAGRLCAALGLSNGEAS